MSPQDNVVAFVRATRRPTVSQSEISHPSASRAALPQAWAEDDGWTTIAAWAQRALDPAIVFGALAMCAAVHAVPFGGHLLALALLASVLSCFFFKGATRIALSRHGTVTGLAVNVAGSWLLLAGALIVLGSVTGTLHAYAGRAVHMWLGVTPLLLFLQHAAARAIMLRYAQSAKPRRAVIVGVNPVSLRLMQEIKTEPNLRLAFMGFFDDRSPPRIAHTGLRYLRGQIGDLLEYVVREQVEVIYVALPMVKRARILGLLDRLRGTTASIHFVPDMFVFDLIQGRVAGINGLPVVAVCETPFKGVNAVVKRLSDLVLAAAVLLVTAPVLLAIAIGVRLGSKGPVLLKQRRYDMDGKEIVTYRFRTMPFTREGQPVARLPHMETRAARFGRFLRRTSLDALPRFINVLQGRMSVVGPRAHLAAHNQLYRRLVSAYMVRRRVRPGITGWAQVNGLQGDFGQADKLSRCIEYDLDYLRSWSLALDLKIVLRSMLALFQRRHA